ncbi:spore coat protein YlbD [Jeotgalibacillus campisalis]|uniref:Cytosolic protein n=1 Tax=Jeotgalibacillus campisalis TaxID=220754 RepID=A0A0C2VUB7_9BACL|nr:spore coat protein YlbD [Jeotgalibacillus campisalis]KIL47598.1 hypothetical protein KR50_17650 [Jeotgalibacillus campisalis]
MEQREQRLQEFKAFLVKNPHIIQKVRNKERTWQDLFEDWYLFGEDDKRWLADSSESATSKQWIHSIKTKLQSLDDDQIEQYVEQCKDALEMVSGLLSQFQSQTSKKAGPSAGTKNESYMTYWK